MSVMNFYAYLSPSFDVLLLQAFSYAYLLRCYQPFLSRFTILRLGPWLSILFEVGRIILLVDGFVENGLLFELSWLFE